MLFRCDAVGYDRVIVRDLLLKLYETLQIRNILRAIEILEMHWAVVADEADVYHRRSEIGPALLDFIPY